VRLGAVVVVESGNRAHNGMSTPRADSTEGNKQPSEPLACVEVVGRSVLDRTIERLIEVGVELISVLVGTESAAQPLFRCASEIVTFQAVDDVQGSIADVLGKYAEIGIEHCFVNSADTYSETDLLDFFYFHRASRQKITRAFDGEGPLALWVADCTKAQDLGFEFSQSNAGDKNKNDAGKTSYFVREYVRRLAHVRDLRQLATDALRGECALRPTGREIRPGVWIDDGAVIHRGVRIVAPAYIGRGSEVMQDALITRCASIERDCCIDCGTVIEDSSILQNTHVGIWLDVCHAVVWGNRMLSVTRDVTIEIADPRVIRINSPVRENLYSASERNKRRENEADLRDDKHPMAAIWQLGANFIQE
jgi:NDP-sugar pyrophosphorylase family protein